MADSTNPLRILWHPAVAWLIAAGAVAALVFWPKPEPDVRTIREAVPYPAAIIASDLPEDFQKENPLVYSSPTDQIYLLMRALVRPQVNHTYDLRLTRGANDSTVIELFGYDAYDSSGYALFSTQTDTGQFTFSIYDIAGTDTAVTSYPFQIKLEAN